MKKISYYLLAFISVAAGMIGFNYYSTPLPAPEHALYYQQPRAIQPFVFIDHNNKPFTQAQLTDKWSLVFMGYTSCPDVCPTTLQNLHFIYDDILAITEKSQVLFVTSDPKRDNIEKLKLYINYFNKDFRALRADHDVLYPFSRNLGLMYAIDATSNEDIEYGVDHSASIVLINPKGKVAAIFKPEHAVGEVPVINNDKLLIDFQRIVALY